MSKVGFIYDDIFLQHHTPFPHPEKPERLMAINSVLEKREDLKRMIFYIKPDKATEEDLRLIHTEAHIHRILNMGEGFIDEDTYIGKDSAEAALYAVGAVKTAISAIAEGRIQRAFCAVRPPGHHATPNAAMGFCLFNNVAVGARIAQREGFGKVFIIDFDVHHGNGTQDAFYEEDTVFYFSTHESPHYPFTGKDNERGAGKGTGYTYNIPMKPYSGDTEYQRVYGEILPDLITRFSPDMLLVSAGYDIHRDDPLASLQVSYEGIRFIVKKILEPGVPAIFCLEGGYHLQALSESVAITIEEMLRCE